MYLYDILTIRYFSSTSIENSREHVITTNAFSDHYKRQAKKYRKPYSQFLAYILARCCHYSNAL